MSLLTDYYKIVEDVIKDLGVDPIECRGMDEDDVVEDGQWNLSKANASIWIDVFYDETNKENYFQVFCPLIEVPNGKMGEVATDALEIGHVLFGIGFTRVDNWLYLKHIRELTDLSKNEIANTIDRIGVYGEEYEEYFREKYIGGR